MPANEHLPSSRPELGKPFVAFTHLRREADRPGEDLIWVQVQLDEDWVAAYRLVGQDDRHVIAEVRLFPYEENVDVMVAGQWSGDPLSTPDGGVPADVLRRLHTDHVLQAVEEFLEYVEDDFDGREYLEHVLPRFELDRGRGLSDRTPRRRLRRAFDVARAAEAYASAPQGGRRQAVADALGYSPSGADKLIRDARDRGFLEGGELTDRARRVLDASDSRPR